MASGTGKTTRGGKAAGTDKPGKGDVPLPEGTPGDEAAPRRDWTDEPADASVEKRAQSGDRADGSPKEAAEHDPAENIFADDPVPDERAAPPVGDVAPAAPDMQRADPFAVEPLSALREQEGLATTPEERSGDNPVDERASGNTDPAGPDLAKPEPAQTAEPTRAVPAPPAQPPAQRSGGFVAPLLGGVLAALIGYGMAIYGWSTGLSLPFLPDRDGGAEAALSEARADFAAMSEAQTAEIAALQAELGALRDASAPTDSAAIGEQLDELAAALAEVEARLSDPAGAVDDSALAALQDRIAALEEGPSGTPAEAGEMAALRDSLAALQGEVAQISAESDAAAEAAEAELAARATDAEAAAARAAERAALSQLMAALDTGAPLTPALEAFDAAGLTTPEALAAAGDGVPTLAALQAAYPDAAREALAAAHAAEDPADPVDRLGSFLRAQVQLRSLSPREGEDADAVLSRAEAALRAGDLATAVAEVETLPEPAQPAMAGWLADARTRLAAVQAADSLAAEIDTQ